jgi:hypothetical protein
MMRSSLRSGMSSSTRLITKRLMAPQNTARRPTAIHLASSSAPEIALWVRHAIEYLRPEWLEQPIKFKVPRGLENDIPPLPELGGSSMLRPYVDRLLCWI